MVTKRSRCFLSNFGISIVMRNRDLVLCAAACFTGAFIGALCIIVVTGDFYDGPPKVGETREALIRGWIAVAINGIAALVVGVGLLFTARQTRSAKLQAFQMNLQVINDEINTLMMLRPILLNIGVATEVISNAANTANAAQYYEDIKEINLDIFKTTYKIGDTESRTTIGEIFDGIGAIQRGIRAEYPLETIQCSASKVFPLANKYYDNHISRLLPKLEERQSDLRDLIIKETKRLSRH
ncbi:hypothetical protein [Pseudovibrio ascidiaceicola]|uniref:hypothetical protein n=1 Tax=Pseudovibrio ascidiaceicola TaxID=285279 RepID=UPI000B88FBD4|nr:hypothetical protein [Pseudovibrio ascidiaceicola]